MNRRLKFAVIPIGFVLVAAFLTKCNQSIENQMSAMKVADRYALETSIEIRNVLEETSTCPALPRGWEAFAHDDHDNISVKMGNEHGLYRVTYRCDEDNSFNIAVLYSFDSGTYYSGKANNAIKVKYGHFTNPEHLYIKDASEVESALNQLHD